MSALLSPTELKWREQPATELIRLAWPIAVSMISFSLMTVVDTMFVGRLGPAALAGVGLGGIAVFTLISFGIGLLRAVKVLISQAVGAGERGLIPGIVGSGIVLAFALGAAMLLVGVVLAPTLQLLAATPQAGHLAVDYASVRMLSAPIVLLGIALRETRYGLGDSQSAMRAAVIANVLHVPLNALLIFWLDFGVRGAAAATVTAHVIESSILLLAQRSDGLGLASVTRERVRTLLRIGLPIGMEFLLAVTAFAALVALIAQMSDHDLAAHQIALQLTHVSFLPALAIGEASSVLSGQAVGARRDELVRRVAWVAIKLAWVYCGFCALVFLLAGGLLVQAFTTDVHVQAIAVRLLYIAAAFQLLDVVSIVLRCSLRGAGDVRYAALVSVVTAWLLGPPSAALFGLQLGFGAPGAWFGLALDIGMAALVLWVRLRSDRWRHFAEQSRKELRSNGPIVAAAA